MNWYRSFNMQVSGTSMMSGLSFSKGPPGPNGAPGARGEDGNPGPRVSEHNRSNFLN